MAARNHLALGHIKDDGMGMELGSGVAIDWAGRVMLELCGDEFAGCFGGVVAADPRLCVSLQLREGNVTAAGGPRGYGGRRQLMLSRKRILGRKTSHPIRPDALRV